MSHVNAQERTATAFDIGQSPLVVGLGSAVGFLASGTMTLMVGGLAGVELPGVRSWQFWGLAAACGAVEAAAAKWITTVMESRKQSEKIER